MEVSVKLFLEKRNISLSDSIYHLIFDLPKELFLKNIVYLYQYLLYPLYLEKKKIIFIDFPFEFGNISISQNLIHTNPEAISMHLYLESWQRIINYSTPKKEGCNIKLESLNDEQRRVLTIEEGPVCLVAAAGSGKTKTLVNRVYHLLNKGISQDNILVLVFNKKAEEEITMRIGVNCQVEVRTFHSFGYQILKEYSDYEFDESMVEGAVDSLLEAAVIKYYPMVYQSKINPLRKYREMLSLVKNQLYLQSEMVIETDYKKQDFYLIFNEYLRLQKEEKLHDYDDMLYLAYCLLLKNPTLRNAIQDRYQYLLVDEFQDFNKLQLSFLELLNLPRQNLFVVGDDDQMIYGFRGANVRSILDFKKKYPFAHVFYLTTNYRSKRRIVYHANLFISHNIERTNKVMKPFHNELGEVYFHACKDMLEECTKIEDFVNYTKGSTAILYRYHSQGLFIKIYLQIKKLLGVEEQSFLYKIIIFISLFLSPFTKTMGQNICKYLSLYWKDECESKDAFIKFLKEKGYNYLVVDSILINKDMSFADFCCLLKQSCDFYFYNEEVKSNLLFSFFDKIVSTYGGVKGFYFYYINNCLTTKDILLTTIHKTKGNEFSNVCYFHFDFDNYPSEEERRISYVAMTRAKGNLLITSTSISKVAKEYLCNITLKDKSNNQLLSEMEEVKGFISIKKHYYQLQVRDQNRIKSHLNFEIREDVKDHYYKKKKSLYNSKKIIKKLDDELFILNEEYRMRNLSYSDSRDIIKVKKE